MNEAYVADLFQRSKVVLSYLNYQIGYLTADKKSHVISIYPEQDTSKGIPTLLQCDQLDAVTDALKETGYKVESAFMSKEGVITVYPAVEGANKKRPPKGWKKMD